MSKKIIITGAAGFIGSQCAKYFASKTYKVVAIDHQNALDKRPYLIGIDVEKIDAEQFLNSISLYSKTDLVIHMGAITNTAANDKAELNKWNVEYSQAIWNFCSLNKIPLIYASSAATYGDGMSGFSDEHSKIVNLKPLNLYGLSKHEFDLWALKQTQCPPHWHGLKFFNVYGPNEDHKARMASSVWHGYNEIKKSGSMTLFKSHHLDFKDGEQSRDFIYINDILSIMDFLILKKPESGIYNCGTGQAETFMNLAKNLFVTLKLPLQINWIDTPEEFRRAYQYKTEALMTKLQKTGYTRSFTKLDEGVRRYLGTLIQKA